MPRVTHIHIHTHAHTSHGGFLFTCSSECYITIPGFHFVHAWHSDWLPCHLVCVCVFRSVCDYAAQCCCRSEHARVTKLWLHVPIPVSVETKNTGTCSSIPPSLPLAHFSSALVGVLAISLHPNLQEWLVLSASTPDEGKKKWVEFICL